MKNKNLVDKFTFAFRGIKETWKTERSFRIQSFLFLLAAGVFIFLQASGLWLALFCLSSGLVFSAEVLNTAIEKLANHVQPALNPAIKTVKDAAAGAVLIGSFSSIGVFLLFLIETFLR